MNLTTLFGHGSALKGLSMLVATFHPGFATAETVFDRLNTQLPSFAFMGNGAQNNLIDVAELFQNDTGHNIQDVRLWGMRPIRSSSFSDFATGRDFQCLLIRMEGTTAVSFCQIQRNVGASNQLNVMRSPEAETLLLFPWLILLQMMAEDCRPEDYAWQAGVGEAAFYFFCQDDGTPFIYSHNSGPFGGAIVGEIEF